MALVLVLGSGCAATSGVDVERFQKYRGAFSELSSSAEAALAFERQWAYDNYMVALKSGGFESPSDVILKFPAEADDPFGWSLPKAPIFLTLRETEAQLARVNDVFSEYISLLVALAGGDSGDSERIEALATDLNHNSRSAGRALGLDVEAQHAGFFATAAASAAKAYLARKRSEDLRAVLERNQKAVEAFAGLGAEAAELSAIGIKDEYQDATQRWIQRVVDTPPGGRAELVEEQLGLNERTISQLQGLRKLHDGYLALAEAHSALARTVATSSPFSVDGLAEQAREVRDLYNRLKASALEKPSTTSQ